MRLTQPLTLNHDIAGIKFHTPANLDARYALSVLESNYKDLEARFNKLLEERNTQGLSEEKQQAIQQRSEKAASKLEMSEAETRQLIDEQLRLAGWEADTAALNYKKHKTLPERGKNKAIAEWSCGPKWADYALFVGLELYAIVEAKKYAHDIPTDLGVGYYATLKVKIDKLPQALLAKAFRGELVPQDANDEPASVLLEKIKAAKAATAKPAKGKKAKGGKQAELVL